MLRVVERLYQRLTHGARRGIVKERGFKRVFCCGLATDFCVRFSAEDAVKQGFETVVIEEACRAIDMDRALAVAREAMVTASVELR